MCIYKTHGSHHIGKCLLFLPVLSSYVLLLLEESTFPVGRMEEKLKTFQKSVKEEVTLKTLTLCNGSSRSWMALLMASCGTYEDSPLP